MPRDDTKMKSQARRIFISNLPNNVDQNDLERKFNNFGAVSSVEIKQRQNVGVNQTTHFAYVNLELDDSGLEDCINKFASKKWKGHWVHVQEAKESFMERLKRERAESKVVNGSVNAAVTVMPNSDHVSENSFVKKNKIRHMEKLVIEPEKTLENGNEDKKYEAGKQRTNAKMLFDEEESHSDDENYNFEVKEHFQGKKGQKLMDLQSRFKNDKRFKMDERFLEEESGDDNEEEQSAEFGGVEVLQDDEKQKQLEILEQVLGRKVSKSTKNANDTKKLKVMLRFDPTQPEHSKYEIKETEKQEKSRKKRKNSERSDKVDEAVTVEEAPMPEVSKEKFYKVATDLKDAFQEKGTFSLANMFSKEIESEEQEVEAVGETKPISKQKKRFRHEVNPFRYDSSSEEEDTAENANEEAAAKPVPTLERNGPVRLWSDTFFFKEDDYRLQEGLDFIKRLKADNQDDFGKVRRNLKEIVRAKVRNNQRNNRPFRKKLGGKKRIRVKRALKR